ncbi:hypothetical protein Bca4012_081624 [Brassica carinata]
MEEIEVPFHEHLVRPTTRFLSEMCSAGCTYDYCIYGGYRCNEPGCNVAFHKECAEALPEIINSFHPQHPLKLIQAEDFSNYACSLCLRYFSVGYKCSICDFHIDLKCVRIPPPLVISEKSCLHEHPLKLTHGEPSDSNCALCSYTIGDKNNYYYRCHQCKFAIHLQCVDDAPEAYHTSHPQHPLKSISINSLSDYADIKCLLCGDKFESWGKLYHCDVCNFSICRVCMTNPPQVCVVSSTTHEHQLHLFPRRMEFTCNACGTLGHRSPYFCLQCNFMIHRECIDLPRVININRHDHRISYTPRLGHGHGESPWKCGVCRKKVDGFYGAYTSSKIPSYVVHARCATREDVWDNVELEGTPEEEVIPSFEVVDDTTIRHFSHDHDLHINKDGQILHENIVCDACVFQIGSESFYSCRRCDFILHEKCANLTRKKRHVCDTQPFTLNTVSRSKTCYLCDKRFSGFRYESLGGIHTLDVRCGSISEPFVHESHPHPLYYDEKRRSRKLSCDECADFSLEFKDAVLPKKVMRNRYDDHPLFLSYGESNVNGEYWCEACEAKLDPKEWFYTCNDCGITLHVPCVVGDFSYIKHGTKVTYSVKTHEACYVSNTSICRPFCAGCSSRCMLPTIIKISKFGGFVYVCSENCLS